MRSIAVIVVLVLSHFEICEGSPKNILQSRRGASQSSSPHLGRAENFALSSRSRPNLRASVKTNLLQASARGNEPSGIVPNDLWAIHDLVLLGYYGVMLKGEHMAKNTSDALLIAQAAASKISAMLPSIHPVAKCREDLAKVAAETAGSANPASSMERVAETTWTCLGLSATDFVSPFVSLSAPWGQALQDMHSEPNSTLVQLGDCNGSGWPRACSLWASIHSLALRADTLGLGREFFNATVQVLSGGPLFCVGCTRHVRLLAKPIVPSALLDADSFVGI